MKKRLIPLLLFAVLFINLVVSAETFQIQENETLSLKLDVEDPDNDQIHITYSEPFNENGEWTPQFGDAGIYNATITVTDGDESTVQEIAVHVLEKQMPPKILSMKPDKLDLIIDQGQEIQFSVDVIDENNDDIQITWTRDNNVVSKDSSYTLQASYNDFGKTTVQVSITDNYQTLRQTWTVSINDVDLPPSFNFVEPVEIYEGQRAIIILEAKDPDGDDIEFVAQDLPQDATIEGNILVWQPSFDTVHPASFSDVLTKSFRLFKNIFDIPITVTSTSHQKEQTIRIIVHDVNRAPVLEPLDTIFAVEGEQFFIQPSAYDPDGDQVTFTYSGWLSQNVYTPSFNEQGTYFVKVTASDGLDQASNFVKIIVQDKNQEPSFAPIKPLEAIEGEPVQIQLDISDPDTKILQTHILNPPTNASLQGNLFTWTPSYDTVSTKENEKEVIIELMTSDNINNIIQEATINVKNKNRAPQIRATSPTKASFKRNTPVRFEIDVHDPDGDELIYSWDVGLFQTFKAGNIHKRTFTSPGTKTISVVVDDGTEKIEHTWQVKIV